MEIEDLFPSGDGEGVGDSEAFQKLRDHAKSLEKDLKTAQKDASVKGTRLAELEQARQADATQRLFQSKGIKPELAELFLSSHKEEPTEEAVSEWASKYGFLQQTEQEPEVKETPEEKPAQTFQPVTGSPVPAKPMAILEWNKLYKENPARAMQMVNDGQVDLGKLTEANGGVLAGLS